MPSSRVSRSLHVFLVASAIAQLVVLVLWAADMIVTRGHHHAVVAVLGIPILVCISLVNVWSLRHNTRNR